MSDREPREDDLTWETLAVETVHQSDDFSVRRDRVALPDGRTIEHESVEEPDTVVVLPFTGDGAVVLVEEWRQAVQRLSRGLPAGSVEPGEELTTAAVRELEEETGYRTDDIQRLGQFEPANGILTANHVYVIAQQCRPSGTPDRDPDESIRTALANYDDLIEAVQNGRFADGRSALGLLYADAVTELPPNSD